MMILLSFAHAHTTCLDAYNLPLDVTISIFDHAIVYGADALPTTREGRGGQVFFFFLENLEIGVFIKNYSTDTCYALMHNSCLWHQQSVVQGVGKGLLSGLSYNIFF